MSLSDDSGALDYHRAREAAAAGATGVPVAPALPPVRLVTATAVILALAAAIYAVGAHGDPAPQLQLSLILGAAFGFVLQRSRFCFLCIWRDWLDRHDPRGLLGILTALATGLVGYSLIYGAWLPDPAGARLPPTAHIGPVGPALVLAGLAFGAGMAISGSCISAHLYRLGEGSPTSPFALVGAGLGFWLGLLSWNELYLWSIADSPVLWLPRHLGYAGALLVGLTVFAALAYALLRSLPSNPIVSQPRLTPLAAIFHRRWPAWVGGLAVGLIGIAAYFRLSPLGVTAELASRSRQAAASLDLLPSRLEGLDSFRGCATVIRDALLTPNGLFIAGLVAAAFAAALIAGEFRPRRPSTGQALRGLIGGALLGWGTIVGLGCTVGTLLSGISAGAVSGWVFALGLIIGTTATLKLGRRLGLLA
ncbi:YeeE/YedE family protein [Bosea caraganae]|uniref:YeeE/YedE family protein n=1 Tax=Bosea caraganae TaxID=2763117 RepID=A0A370LDT0_9HYPH|nr:YeeE/YedE family protein [Bosea caraganae]RDJ27702.1 YeeE/YedE family protein [Bosea caraganae]RDJ29715.1 YeeE/YedE family protein [Bosea caraganae]